MLRRTISIVPTLTDKAVRNRSSSRTRSRGCLATASAPAPRAKYRESNASRLRQEIKGMTVTGIVRHGRRSNTPSPSKASAQSASPKLTNGCPTPKNRCRSDTSPDKTVDSRLQHSPARNRHRLEVSPDKSLDIIATPRTLSETSNASRETQEHLRSLMVNASSGCVVDTRSKTINTVVRQPVSEESSRNIGRKHTTNNVPTIAGPGVGYGKPLVTDLSKKLTVLKELPQPLSAVRNSRSVTSRGKSPARTWRTDNKDSVSSVPGKKFDLMKSKSPAKGAAANKLWTSNTVPKMKPDEKVAILRSSVAGKQIRGSSASDNKYNKSPTRSEMEDILNSRAKPIRPPLHKEIKSSSPELNRSPNRQTSKERPSVPSLAKSSKESPKSYNKDPPSVKPSSIPRPFSRPNTERTKEDKKPLLEPLRDVLSERLKQPLCKNAPMSAMCRPSSGMYSRGFKPQLEDIKSSYMLLNKQNQEKNNKGNMEKANKKEFVSVREPKPFNEEFRKRLLSEARQRFKSKHFWNDSKYDKIEGLNWISWK